MTSDSHLLATDVVEQTSTAHCVLQDETIAYANPAMERLFGAESTDFEGARFLELVAPDDRERVADALAGVGDEPVTVQFDAARAERRPTSVESEWTVSDRTSERALVGSFRDVTERVQRESELERDREMLDSLLGNIPMSIYFKDRQSRHERVSTNMLCSHPDSFITSPEGKRHAHPEDIVGKTDFDLYDPALAESAVVEDQEIMESEEPVFNEVTESTTSLGETIFTSTTKAPRYDEDGDVIGIVGVTMDVTDRLSYERELERQNDRLEEFTEVLAHDLRNPLSVAKAYVELLREEYDEPTLEKMDTSLDRMSTMITQLRTFVIEGRTVESADPVAVSTAAHDSWDSVETGGATIDVAATHTVRADSSRLQRLLENVYRNAIEHGGTDVSVTIGDLADGFFVADDGPGIPEDQQGDVFERGVSTSEDGTGFGLAIVRNIADAHNWGVAVTDSETGGARFEFTDVVRVEEGANQHF